MMRVEEMREKGWSALVTNGQRTNVNNKIIFS